MPRRPAPKAPKSASMPDKNKGTFCSCPFCPLTEFGKFIGPSQAVFENDNETQTLTGYIEPEFASIDNALATLVMFARNNHKLPEDKALIIITDGGAITVARFETEKYMVVYKPYHAEMKSSLKKQGKIGNGCNKLGIMDIGDVPTYLLSEHACVGCGKDDC